MLPTLIGEDNMSKFPELALSDGQLPGKLSSRKRRDVVDKLRAEVTGSHSGPPPEDVPTIRNEFATALFRFGHSMQPNLLQARNKNFAAKENRLMRSL